jgi:hypothetical protein
MSDLTEVGKAFAGWAEENSGLAVDKNFEYTDRTVGNFAAAAFAAGAEWQAQREPTEAEIEAAVSEIEQTTYAHHLVYGPNKNRCSCGELFDNDESFDWHLDKESVKAVLEAARKAVSVDE